MPKFNVILFDLIFATGHFDSPFTQKGCTQVQIVFEVLLLPIWYFRYASFYLRLLSKGYGIWDKL